MASRHLNLTMFRRILYGPIARDTNDKVAHQEKTLFLLRRASCVAVGSMMHATKSAPSQRGQIDYHD
jgi:hypothetical protein